MLIRIRIGLGIRLTANSPNNPRPQHWSSDPRPRQSSLKCLPLYAHSHYPSHFRRTYGTSSSIRDKETEPKVTTSADAVHRNPANIQMISDSLYKQVFTNNFRRRDFPDNVIDKVRAHLSSYSLWNQKVPAVPSVNLQIPPLEGISIGEHFRNIATKQTLGYKKLVAEIMDAQIPEFPQEWVLKQGWTKYSNNGPRTVPFPEEDVYVFDVEVCMSNGHFPTIACAVSNQAWLVLHFYSKQINSFTAITGTFTAED